MIKFTVATDYITKCCSTSVVTFIVYVLIFYKISNSNIFYLFSWQKIHKKIDSKDFKTNLKLKKAHIEVECFSFTFEIIVNNCKLLRTTQFCLNNSLEQNRLYIIYITK